MRRRRPLRNTSSRRPCTPACVDPKALARCPSAACLPCLRTGAIVDQLTGSADIVIITPPRRRRRRRSNIHSSSRAAVEAGAAATAAVVSAAAQKWGAASLAEVRLLLLLHKEGVRGWDCCSRLPCAVTPAGRGLGRGHIPCATAGGAHLCWHRNDGEHPQPSRLLGMGGGSSCSTTGWRQQRRDPCPAGLLAARPAECVRRCMQPQVHQGVCRCMQVGAMRMGARGFFALCRCQCGSGRPLLDCL